MSAHKDITGQIMRDTLEGAPYQAYATNPPRGTADAYEIQDALAEALISSGNRAPVAGWKIAANSPALLARFKLEDPVSGRIFGDQNHDSPAALKVSDYTEFAFEPEIAAVMGSTLSPQDAPFDREQVMRAIDRFVPALELLDMRNADMQSVHIADAIAQNISNVGAVRGGPGASPDQLDADAIHTVVSIDGTVVHDVTGAAPQPPVEAVLWLANHLAARGLTLEAGQIVLCGTHSPIWYHKGPGEIRVEMSGLGTVIATLG